MTNTYIPWLLQAYEVAHDAAELRDFVPGCWFLKLGIGIWRTKVLDPRRLFKMLSVSRRCM